MIGTLKRAGAWAVIVILLLPMDAFTQDLETLSGAPVLKSMKRRSERDRINLKDYNKFLPANQEYSRIFIEGHGGELLNTWLGVRDADLKINEYWTKFKYTDESIRSYIFYDIPDTDKETVKVEVVLPSPNHRALAEFNLLPEVRVLEPPALKVTNFTNVKIGGHEGKFYQGVDGFCSYLFKLNKDARINFSSQCHNRKSTRSIVKQLNISRLNAKLNM